MNERNIKEIEYINKLSCDEITALSEKFKNSDERREQKLNINKRIVRKIIGQNNNVYEFVIYEYYYYVNGKKHFKRYYPEKYIHLFHRTYDTKLVIDSFYQYCGLIRNKFVKISWNLCKYYANKYDLFNQTSNIEIKKQYANTIYISIDDCYGKARGNNKVSKTNSKIIKIFSDKNESPIYTYETYTSQDKEKLTNKSRAELIMTIIQKYYVIDTNTKLYLLSDGAVYFKNLAKLLNAEHIYDHFHFIKHFNFIFKKPIFIIKNDVKEKLLIDNQPVWKWLQNSIENKDEFIDKLLQLLTYEFNNKNTKNNIKAFLKFINNNCKDLKFNVNNITAQSESSVSLFKSLYKKRYSTFSLNTIFNLISINKSEKCNFLNFKSLVNEIRETAEITYEPILWNEINYNHYWNN
ncbi:hypothetical protein H9M94_02855 [Mycoplasma sp. Pen4]|uniref:Mbov_0401 family ICE element transposase-like protein n=1 Tax=Mycoplasma sp. Pen4 TaxID=640330 RepID=UPI0016540470|nr:hypothetical protein [Mycoplasma sp. Pen4]QNM93526.1 hypothetical protein H9M94_02855 [Mycoplasma sp. Pen4]